MGPVFPTSAPPAWPVAGLVGCSATMWRKGEGACGFVLSAKEPSGLSAGSRKGLGLGRGVGADPTSAGRRSGGDGGFGSWGAGGRATRSSWEWYGCARTVAVLTGGRVTSAGRRGGSDEGGEGRRVRGGTRSADGARTDPREVGGVATWGFGRGGGSRVRLTSAGRRSGGDGGFGFLGAGRRATRSSRKWYVCARTVAVLSGSRVTSAGRRGGSDEGGEGRRVFGGTRSADGARTDPLEVCREVRRGLGR